jgi:hypothetical protein
MKLEILGPGPFELDALGRPKSGIGTLFPRHDLLVTLPGIHATQRMAFLEWLIRRRADAGQAPLCEEEQEYEVEYSVDLFLEPGTVLIRPDPENLALAFEGDECLQQTVSKRRIKFLFAFDSRVQAAMKQRGECWRISRLPTSPADMVRLVRDSKGGICEAPVYYCSRPSGTRHLTLQEFAQLERLPDHRLAAQLQEIGEYAGRRNRLGNPEIGFFEADPIRFGACDFGPLDYGLLPEGELRARHAALVERFRDAVPAAFRQDDLRLEAWRNRMFTLLVSPPSETVAEEVLQGLGAEFFLQVEWLPGGRFEEGELILDSIFDEAERCDADPAVRALCDAKVKGFIFNFIREYGDLEYVNVGRIVHSMSKRAQAVGRRDVYIAELKPHGASASLLRFVRLLKWGIRERLNEGKGLLQAMMENEEYVDYILDRRLGCRQLGMNLPLRITIQRVGEIYEGPRADLRGQLIHTPYGERDYLPGIATDKLPAWKYARDGYAERLARLLGRAAAPNLAVGRTYAGGERVIFDDGDEVITEGEDGLPRELIAGDHSGAFDEYQRPLLGFAKDYARPVNDRLAKVPLPREFAGAYLEAFEERLHQIQGEYRKRRRAFDALFKHCRYDPAGSFAYRWECVLRRLDQTDVTLLAQAVRKNIAVLASGV